MQLLVTLEISGGRSIHTEVIGLDQKRRIARIVREYDAQGWHRTGTETDHESARWLADKGRELGLDAVLEPFSLSRIDPELCYLEVDGRRIEGLPMYDGTFTGPEGVHGRIGLLGSSAEIGVAQIISEYPVLHPSFAGDVTRDVDMNEALRAARRSVDYSGLVVVGVGRMPGLMASNAPDFRAPFGPPVLQVSSEVQTLIFENARCLSEAHLVASVRRTDTESFNVVGRLSGSDGTLPPLVVMTPRSGWWHCAGERGGGLACWLEVMRALCEAGSLRDVIFVATSAHELGYYGIEAFLESHHDLVEDACTWVHFGADIGAAQEPGAQFSATDDDLKRQTQAALKRAGTMPVTAAPRGTTLGGESQLVARHGGRVVALIGNNALFHLETDRWPEAVDVEAVARFAKAFTDIALQLAHS